ncbi:MAG: Fur family transcriptional regulator [Chloroflexota bacterium]
MDPTNETLTVLQKALGENGYRLTESRRVILEALVTSGGHLTADGLVEVVNKDSPNVGRMTVYRTLDLLCNLGLLRAVYQGTGAAHFILMHDGHHHHLICSQCERVIEFDECVAGEMTESINERFGFQVQGHLLEFYGLCSDCLGDSAT